MESYSFKNVDFTYPEGEKKALCNISFTVQQGEFVILCGPSGCGKTTTGRSILRLYEPTAGTIKYAGEDITHVNMLPYRKKMQIVFQDPYASLDPRMTVGDIIGEGIDLHNLAKDKQDRYNQIIKLLGDVGLNSEHANRYPHEFSGGQRQRLFIARAVISKPDILILDDASSALDYKTDALLRKALNDNLKDEINNAMRDACEHYGVYFVELENIDKLNDHPTKTGMTQIREQTLDEIF